MLTMTGAQVVVQALIDNGVDLVFGYPGGAVLPIYDALFSDDRIRHVLVRHEQGAVHAAEGYARSTGKVGCVLVTSGPGATNTVTGLTDALMDSIPIVCVTGQVPTYLIGSDAFQEADTVGITRHCTKHNYLVKDPADLCRVLHEAFHVAASGRPGPVLVDVPKDLQFAEISYQALSEFPRRYAPEIQGASDKIDQLVTMMTNAKQPIFYTGGGVINSGPEASKALRALVDATGFPVTSTLMGLGAYPASGSNWLGMLGMHGTYEANLAMHECDLMINVCARFDDRITGKVDAFSPSSRKVHIDIDASSINKNIPTELGIVGDAANVLNETLRLWKKKHLKPAPEVTSAWWPKIDTWRNRRCLSYKNSDTVIKPQFALQRLQSLISERDFYVTTDVGQHQMWAAQFLNFNAPRRWMTSGGLGTMGYGLPAAIGVQLAHPEALTICVTGEASILMNIQELSTAVQYRAPVKVLILNNGYMGMVRQWQEMLHGGRYSESYVDVVPNFARLAEAFHLNGASCSSPADLDDALKTFIDHPGPFILDCHVAQEENCFPMIPSGKPHNEMILPDFEGNVDDVIDDEGKKLV